MELIELGIESAKHRRLCALHEKWMVHLHHPFCYLRRLFLAVRVFPQR